MSNIMTQFMTWLSNLYNVILEKLFNIVVDVIQMFIDAIPTFITSLLTFFSYSNPVPSNVSAPSSAVYSMFITCVNWVFPMAFLVQLVTFVVAAMAFYFSTMIILRWVKAGT